MPASSVKQSRRLASLAKQAVTGDGKVTFNRFRYHILSGDDAAVDRSGGGCCAVCHYRGVGDKGRRKVDSGNGNAFFIKNVYIREWHGTEGC